MERKHNRLISWFSLFLAVIFVVSCITVISTAAADMATVGRENSADFLSFQTAKPDENGKFNMRLIAGTNSLLYRNFGYRIILIRKDEDGNPVANELQGTDVRAYTSVYGGGCSYNIMDTFGYQYACIATVTGLDFDSSYLEMVIRPYITEPDGSRKYGKTAHLLYTGETDENGYPTFQSIAKESKTDSLYLMASDDSYVKYNETTEIHGAESTLGVKTNGTVSKYGGNTRFAYIRFELTQTYKDAFLTADRAVNLTLTPSSVLSLSSGGYNVLEVYLTDADWTEETLTNQNQPAVGSKVGEIALNGNSVCKLDVTSAVRTAIESGASAISFRLSGIYEDGSNINQFYSKESSSNKAPCLSSADDVIFPYELNFDKQNNLGYEPWAYAEQLVAEWLATEKDNIYSGGQSDVLNLNNTSGPARVAGQTPQGAYSVKIEGCGSGNPPTPSFKTYYARTLDSLTANGGYTQATGSAVTQYDEYGGITNAGFVGNATGFYHTEEHGGRIYIIDPIGNPYFVCGVNTLNTGSSTNQQTLSKNRFGSAYWSTITTQLRSFGINLATGTTGGYTTPTENYLSGIVGVQGISSYMRELGLTTSTGGSSTFLYGNTMNVFDPDFLSFTETKNKGTLESYKNNKKILGYTSDNELPDQNTLLDQYLNLDCSVPVNAFSYATAWTWLSARTGNLIPDKAGDVNDTLREEFKAFVFGRLFKTISAQIEKYDGNHMYIGTRANGGNRNSEGYLRAAGRYCEVLTINMYDGLEPASDKIAAIYRYSGRPFIVTEFYSKAQESYDANGQLLANQQNAGWLVKTQSDRAVYYQNYTLLLLESKYCAGWLWFRFQDNDQSLFTVKTDDGKTFTNLRVWEKGAGRKIRSFILPDCKDGATTELVQLSAETEVAMGSPVSGIQISYYENGVKKTTQGKITMTYKGETDTSGLGSNKGLVDDNFNFYTRGDDPSASLQVCDAIKLIGDNLISLIHYFDNLHAN